MKPSAKSIFCLVGTGGWSHETHPYKPNFALSGRLPCQPRPGNGSRNLPTRGVQPVDRNLAMQA